MLAALFSAATVYPQQSSRLQEKIDRAIKGTFEIDSFRTKAISIPPKLQEKTIAKFDNNQFFQIIASEQSLGYAYVGSAASMKKKFEYILMFKPDLSIKKSKVLIYRENYGRQIGSQRWLIKFVGFTPSDELTYGENIDAISGTTISASSMTNATADVLKSIRVLIRNEVISN